MRWWRYIGLCLFLGGITTLGNAQGWENLPVVEPARMVALDEEDQPTLICISDILWDATGRLWLKTCGNASEYRMTVLQYDGYRLSQVNLQEYRMQGNSSGGFVHWPGQETIWGFINTRNNGLVYNLRGSDQELVFSAPLTSKIKDIVMTDDLQLWAGVQTKDDYLVYQYDTQEPHQVLSLQWPHHAFPSEPDYSRVIPRLSYTGDQLWISARIPPVYRYDWRANRLDTIWVTDSDIPLFNPPQPMESNVATQDDTTYVFLLDQPAQLYTNIASSKKLYPVTDLPKSWECLNFFTDEIGQILFLFKDAQGRRRLILQDQEGKRLDYSAFAEFDSNIHNYRSPDFRKELFIATKKGAYYADVKRSRGIQTFDSGNMRWLIELPDGSILLKAQGKGPLTIQNGVISEQQIALESSLQSQWNISPGRMLFHSPDGRAWAILKNYLFELDLHKKVLETHQLAFELNKAIFIDDHTLLVIAWKSRKLYRYDLRTRQTEPILLEGPKLEISAQIQHLHYNQEGVLRIATATGFYAIDLKQNRWELLGITDDFSDFRFLFIHEAPNGNLWLGTVNSGIIIYDPNNRKVLQTINRTKGLSNNTVVSMLADEEGDIWVATYNGLNIISPEGDIVAKLYEDNGLSHHEFNRFSYLRSRDGKLWFGTIDGMNVIDPLVLKTRLREGRKTQLYLRALNYYDGEKEQEYTLQNPDPKRLPPIQLKATRRNLSVELAMSNYGYTDRNRFAYQLEGINKEWIYLGSNQRIELNNLPPGRYRLLIKGIDHRGNWTEPLAISIRTKDFFYKQSWFYLLLLAGISTIAAFWIRRLRSEKVRLESEVHRRTQQIRQDKELIEQQASELQKLDQLKSRFFTNISHELRTPITLITAPIENLLRESATVFDHKVKMGLQLVLNNGRKLIKLVEELLELSRLEAEKVILQPSPIALQSFCKQLFQNFAAQAESRGIVYTFKTNLTEEDTFLIDRNPLEKILNNLLSNALKFTPKGKSVKLNVWQEEEYLCFQVQDDGQGIPAEDLPHIFDRYFQTKSTNLPQGSGTGIGLALSRELAELMQARLSVESSWGEGSTFVLRLLAEKAGKGSASALEIMPPDSMVSIPEPTASLVQGTHSALPKILIVEDNPEMRQFIHSLFVDRYDCVLLQDGQEAWAYLQKTEAKEGNIQLICSDLRMPRMDGYAFLKILKEDAYWQQIPTIMLTARAMEEAKLKALRLGVDDYIVKPFSSAELQVRAANLIDRYQKRQQYQLLEPLPADAKVPSIDQTWLAQVDEYALMAIQKQIPLSTTYLSSQLSLSSSTLLRRLRTLTGLSIKQYIQEVKLQQARQLLESQSYQTISEIAYASGFNTPGYFTKVYEKRFGKRPADYFGNGLR